VEPEHGPIVGLPTFIFSSILWLNAPFSLVQLSSHLTLCLYAKRSAHPDILLGTHEMRIPPASQCGSFAKNFLSSSHLNISRPDIPCVLENGVGGVARSTQPVILYITVNIAPPNPYNSPPNIPTESDVSPATGATLPERIQFPAPEPLLPSSHHQPVETGDTMPQSREEMSPTSAKNPRVALRDADKVMERIVPVDRSNTWENAVGRIKWVMDTLSPIAEVRIIPFDILAELTSRLSFPHSQRWRTVYFQQSPRHVRLHHFPNEMLMLYSSGS
jgi:hypothetical protein